MHVFAVTSWIARQAHIVQTLVEINTKALLHATGQLYILLIMVERDSKCELLQLLDISIVQNSGWNSRHNVCSCELLQ